MNVAEAPPRPISRERGEEREHEVHAALFGIEASAEVLSRHRRELTEMQLDQLAHGMAQEVRRLRELLAGRTGSRGRFDLGDAIAPVIGCARASGLEVNASVPRGIEVEGRRDSTGQVVLALLDNARHHAAPSPVEVRTTVRGGSVTLYVEDRGRGVSGLSPERLFDRGVRGADSTGTGLGLFVARQLMTEQGGSIAFRPRVGGGASFMLRFRRPSSKQTRLDSGVDVPFLIGR